MITVGDLLELAMPSGTQVLAGSDSLQREVTWATRPRPSPPAFSHLKGGEIVILSDEAMTNLDDRMTLESALRQLAPLGVSAVAYLGSATAKARAAADESGVALLRLPASADLSLLERETSHLITERSREAHRSGLEGGRRLMELAIAGETISTIVRALAELAGYPVALESRDGRMLAYQPAARISLDRDNAETLLANGRSSLQPWLRQTSAGSPADPPAGTFPLTTQFARIVAPVIGRDGPLGNLSIIVRADSSPGEIETLTSRGAAACAVVLARESATLAARREIELNLLDEVLDGALRSEVTLLQQARRLGHDLQAPHLVLVARADSATTNGVARAREHRWTGIDEIGARRGPRLLWRVRNNTAEILWPVAESDSRTIAARFHEELARRADASVSISLAAGSVKSGLRGIQDSHHEAKQALSMGRRLHGTGGLTIFDELGVYRLIFAAEHLSELSSFHDETLSSLIEYDASHSGDLINTLKAFFDAKCGPKEAAGLLEVHRNTVLYRLERVKEITGFDLDDANVRLRLHLALCVHTALRESASER